MTDLTKDKGYMTQAELARYLRTSESCIKNWRERGYLPYFRIPGSTRVLYPVKGVEEVERQFTFSGKGVIKRAKRSEIKRMKPVVSC